MANNVFDFPNQNSQQTDAGVLESIKKLIEFDDENESTVLSSRISDLAAAIELLRKAADLGYAPAQYLMGNLYYYGSDAMYEDEVEWLQMAAEQGLAPTVDPTEAEKWYRKAAEQGFVEAQTDLAYMYDKGEGVPEDKTEAAKWYRKAAEQGYVYAQYLLGMLYDYGRGVPKDRAEAARLYRMAADQGNDDAQYLLGLSYYFGHGVPEDKAEAVKLFRMAADQGNEDAQEQLEDLGYS